MGNRLNPFEEQLKKAANSFEAPYDASAWSRLENQLNQGGASGISSFTKWVVAAVVVASVGIAGYYYNQTPNIENTPIVLAEDFETEELELKEEAKEELTETVQDVPTSDFYEVKDVYLEEKADHPQETESEKLGKTIQDESQPEKKDIPDNTITPIIDDVNLANELDDNSMPVVDVVDLVIVTHSTSVCPGIEITFSLEETPKNDVIWTIGEGQKPVNASDKSIQYVFNEEGEYTVLATDVITGKVSNELVITVNPKPDASFLIRENIERGAIPVVYFASNHGGEKYYQWNLGDGTSFSGEGTSHTYRKSKDYEISLRVMNKYGCFQSSYQRYTVYEDFNLLAPNSFSPNGDDKNEEWMPQALSTGYYDFELVIFDRNNKQIFVTSDPEVKFNGIVNGNVAASGEMFLWKAYVVDPNGIRQQYAGTIIAIY